MTERRSESRYLCADMVRLDRYRGEDEVVSMEAVLEDISPPGACIQVEEPVMAGETVTLWLGENHFTGQVCYCIYREYGYFVGLEFSRECRWSEERVAPRHLTNLVEIAHEGART